MPVGSYGSTKSQNRCRAARRGAGHLAAPCPVPRHRPTAPGWALQGRAPPGPGGGGEPRLPVLTLVEEMFPRGDEKKK